MAVVRRSGSHFVGQRRLRRLSRAGPAVGSASVRRSCWPGSTVA